jgi:hypothetical protein
MLHVLNIFVRPESYVAEDLQQNISKVRQAHH